MLSITAEDKMEKHLEAAGWITICFAVLYFGGHLIVALAKWLYQKMDTAQSAMKEMFLQQATWAVFISLSVIDAVNIMVSR